MDDLFAKRKRGRPRRPENASPAMMQPWFDKRVGVHVIISSSAVAELRRYVRWAAALAAIDEREALFRTLDAAILEFTRRDKLWRKQRQAVVHEECRALIYGGSPPAQPARDEPTLVTAPRST